MLNNNLVKLIVLLGSYFVCFVLETTYGLNSLSSICKQEYEWDKYENFCRKNDAINRNDCDSADGVCSQWCKNNGVNWSVINSDVGHVKFSLIPSPFTCCHTSFKITLYVLEGEECNNYTQSSKCNHSHKTFRVGNNCSMQNDMIEFDVMYVFTSRYYFEIKPFSKEGSRLACISNEIDVKTNYEKQLIGNIRPNVQPVYSSLSEELKIDVVWIGDGDGIGGLPSAERVAIQLWPCGGSGDSLYILSNNFGEVTGECCRKGYSGNNTCNCQWKDLSLVCSFFNIGLGNYCIHIEAMDLRCNPGTLWVTSTTDCSWTFNHSVSEEKSSYVTNYIPPNVSQVSNNILIWWLIIVGTVILLVLSIICCIYFKTYPKKIYHHYVTCAPQPIHELSTLNKPKILLLYPRDCKKFMAVMQNFRYLLKEFLHTQVYDVWDVENWDKVIEVGHQWTMRYITDKNVKVIVIASPCSKIFENALINHKTVKYKQEPNCLDNLFLYSLKESIHLANRSLDNYQRFFVVRLEEPGCEDDKFISITPCTVYTIPQHLKDLTLQIHNMNPSEVIVNPEETSKINQLISSLNELKRYKINDPDYLKEFITIVDEEQ